MSLTDLKNKQHTTPKKKVSVDEFIEQANAYAQGKPSHISRKIKRRRNYKNATFSLGEQHITALNHIAEQSGLAKSLILRMLIEHLAKGPDADLSQLLEDIEHQLAAKK